MIRGRERSSYRDLGNTEKVHRQLGVVRQEYVLEVRAVARFPFVLKECKA
jgi:hypothetical protein